MSPQVRIGPFATERVLGHGSFATVWLARDEDLDALVAIKVLAENWSQSEAVRGRFVREARMLRQLDHDSVVRVYSVGVLEDGRPYFVMEYADRGTLRDRLATRQSTPNGFSVAEALTIGREIAHSLAVIHRAHVVHRDIKPSNVLFKSIPVHHRESQAHDQPGALERLLVADFGVARASTDGNRTLAAGTPGYTAPEQWEGRPTAQSDIYSAGLICAELLAGRPLDLPAVRARGAGQWVAAVRSDVPDSVIELLDAAVAQDPAARVATAEELARTVDSVLGGLDDTDTASPAGPTTRVATELARLERKVVTVFSCDLVEFTPGSDRADPEDVRATIDPYHRILRSVVEGFGGTVETFLGDAVLAVFGAPVAHEDDAERAVRAGLAVLEALEGLNTAEGLDLQVRVGIESGKAVVAFGAHPARGERFVSGDVVHRAARLQSEAPVGGIAVGVGTYRATRAIFDYEELGAVAAKDTAEPLRAWRALRARARFGVDITRVPSTPLVGHEIDLALVRATFEKSVAGPSVRLLTVVGEPGIGKSRLVAELFASVDARPELVTWRQGRCLPYGEGITFWALGEIVKAHAGILDSDDAAVAAAKLEDAVPAGLADREWLMGRLVPLVGVGSASGGVAADREESFTAWRRFLESVASSGPAVFVFEDVHWADPALLGFVEHVADWSEGVAMLVVCTARPELLETHPGWGGGKRNSHTIQLEPLTDEETTRLIGSLLNRTELAPGVEALVVERAGGNPLYAEELVRMLRDREAGGVVSRDFFPDSLQGLIASRIDTLAPDRKGLLHDAAVVGKVFWAGSVAAMGGRGEAEVGEALHELGRKELVRRARVSSVEGETEYAFWHSLVRDVAYGQIPRAARAVKHEAAAVWIEQRAGKRLGDVAEVLAHHYTQALELATAAGSGGLGRLRDGARRFLALAGERALNLDVSRAASYLAGALELTPPGHVARAGLVLEAARASWLAGGAPDVEAFGEGVEGFRARGDVRGTARALVACSKALWAADPAGSVDALTEAIELLEPLGESTDLADAYLARTGEYAEEGRMVECQAWADKAIRMARTLGDQGLLAAAQLLKGAVMVSRGDRSGMEVEREALGIAIEHGRGREGVAGYANLGLALGLMEGPGAALEMIEAGLEFAQRRGLREAHAMLESSRLFFLTELGRWGEVLAEAGVVAERLRRVGSPVYTLEVEQYRVRVLTAQGMLDTTAAAEPELTEAALALDLWAGWWGVVAGAETRLATGDHDGALKLLATLEQVPHLFGTEDHAILLTRVVRTLIGAGDVAAAQRWTDHLAPNLPLFEHALATARAALSEANGDTEAAEAAFADAAVRWSGFGVPHEEGLALLGQGRCLAALGRSDAGAVLGEARRILAGLGAAPSVAEADRLLAETAQFSG